MAGISVLILMGVLGILFIIFVVFNVIVVTFIILAIVFGIIRAKKKKYKKTFVTFLILAIIFTILDLAIILFMYSTFFTPKDTGEQQELIAIKDYDYDKVKEYIENGWNPNDSTMSLYYAIEYNTQENIETDNWELLELLLENGANPNVQIYSELPNIDNTPLTYATGNGYYGAAELLIEYGADVNYKERTYGDTPLHAVQYFYNNMAAETVELLLENGADLSIKNNQGESCLDKLNEFEEYYKDYKDQVPDYDEMIEIIDEIKD